MLNQQTSRFKIQQNDADGTFQGHASVFFARGESAIQIEPGAFRNTLSEHVAEDIPVPILWSHDWDVPIGVWTSLREDKKGLAATGALNLKTQKGAEAHSLLKQGALSGLSIGFEIRASHYDKKRKVEVANDIDLWEASIVVFPAATDARITKVQRAWKAQCAWADLRNILAAGGMPSARTFENCLRDVGFSKTQARQLVAASSDLLQGGCEARGETSFTDVLTAWQPPARSPMEK